jgi:hypothetical protein
MIKTYQEHLAIEAATETWGVSLDDLRNRSDEELVLMRQIVVFGLADFFSNKRISEIIDRSESTIETDIYNHEQMLEDEVEEYMENVDLYEAKLEAITV